MKRLNLISIPSILLLLALPFAARAQRNEEYPASSRGSDGKVASSACITDAWYDNWMISAGGGVNTSFAGINDNMFTPAFDVSVTKWAMPAMAFRIGIQGLKGREGLDSYDPQLLGHSPFPWDAEDKVLSWSYFYAHADMLWCATNSLHGYKFDRLWNISPYIHAGYQRMFAPDAYGTNFDRQAVFGAGVINRFRISDRLSLNVDLRASNFNGRFHATEGQRVTSLTALAGLSYNIFKSGWRRVRELGKFCDTTVASGRKGVLSRLRDAQDAGRNLSDENAPLQPKNSGLEEDSNALKAAAAAESARNGDDELLSRIAGAGLVIYYDINKDQFRDCEKMHIADYVRATLAVDPDHLFHITGCTGKGLGTIEHDTFLCTNRVNRVRFYLMSRLDIPEDRIVIKDAIVTERHEDGRLDRCVIFEDK